MFINNTIPQLKLADPIITDTIVEGKKLLSKYNKTVYRYTWKAC